MGLLRRHSYGPSGNLCSAPAFITQANPANIVAENPLLGQPTPTQPNQVCADDITYLSLIYMRWCYVVN